jgi:hydroxyacid-oxoacid transhydrogenase
MAVALTAPEAFRFTFEADPSRHVRAAELLGADRLPERPGNPRDLLPAVVADLMRDVGMPNGLAEVGYAEDDVPALVEGAQHQQRLLATAPREVTGEDLAGILRRSMRLW